MDKIIRLLAFSQYLCLKQLDEDKFLSGAEIDKLDGKLPFAKYDYLHKMLYEKLGFNYDTKDFIPKMALIKKSTLLEFTYENTVEENRILDKVREYYGDEAFLLYSFVILISNLYGVCSVAVHMVAYPKEELVVQKKKKRYQEIEKKVIKYYNELSSFLDDNNYLLKFYDTEFVDKLNALKPKLVKENITISDLEIVHKELGFILPDVVPEYAELLSKEEAAINLVNELYSIKAGKQYWGKYETFCIKVLNYLFIPDFRKIYVQGKTTDGYERRDAIMPNTSSSRFWIDIKNEFQSKNIVFEFKNLVKGYSKTELNQLRIYLSKPTIGKFGILLIRNAEEKTNLLKAQRDAYEQSGILILIVNDFLMKKLIMSKAYFGTCEDIIANEKIKFEINY